MYTGTSFLRLLKDNHLLAVLVLISVLYASFVPLRLAHAAPVVIDSTVNATLTAHNGTTFTVVFTTDQIGYAFYRDSDGRCVYKKTTDGGSTWAATAEVMDPQTDCIRIAVWYDQWTPGNVTGTLIHVVTMDTSSDDLWYSSLNTSGDTTSTPVSISTTQGGTFAAGANLQTITRAANGSLYAGVMDAADGFVVQCTATCTSTSSWSEAGTSTVWNLANDWLLLLPLGTSSNVMAISWVIGTDTLRSKTWNNGSSSWSASWTNIDTCQNNTTYDGHFGATLNKIRGDIYMVSACDVQVLGGGNDDIRSYIYYNSSSTWSSSTAAVILNDATRGITNAKVGLDSNTGNIYAIYSIRSTGTIATTTDVYYKISTSTMANWGSEQGPVNSTRTDIYGLRIDGLNDERIYATWVDAGDSSIHGATIADLTQTTFAQSAYAFFDNQNATSVGSVYGSQDTPAVAPSAGQQFRLRLLMHIGGSGIDSGGQDFKLQYATSTAGQCTSTLPNYVDLSQTTGTIRYYDNSTPASGIALRASASDPIHGADTIVNQSYNESNNFGVISRIQGGQDGKWDFALSNFSGTALQTFCFRAVKSDGSLLNTYNVTPEITVDSPPSMSTVHLNGDQNIALTEGTSTVITATTTISDPNGSGDFNIVTAKIYRSGVGASCTPDDNNCYSNSSCTVNGCDATSCLATCNVNIWFHADPTDPGTTYASESWFATLTVSDARGATSTASSTVTQDVLSLLGFAVTPSISYGSFTPGSSTPTLSQITRVSSTGNVSTDLILYGTNMTVGSGTIPITQQRYATSSGVGYASSSANIATSSPGVTVDINLKKTVSTTTLATTTLWWGIAVPSPQPTGNYTGQNAFLGSVNSLPWP